MLNRIAIITGASSGIGRSTAIKLAKNGLRMVLTARNESELIKVRDIINDLGYGDQCEIVTGDIAIAQTIEKCISKCRERWKAAPSIFLASAGRGLPGTLLTSDEDQWEQLIATNVNGLMYQLKAISKTMLNDISNKDFIKCPSDIIIIGSTIGRNVSPFNSVYGATKFAAHGLAEALRRELCTHGIRVTLIEPGLVSTNFQSNAGYNQEWFGKYVEEVGPVLEGDDIASVVEYIIHLPGHVHLDNISIRPTRQPYP